MNQFDNARRAGRETLALIQGGRSGVEEDSPTSKHTPQHNLPMDAVTKDLLDARLETIEVRIDARMGRIEELIGDTRREIDLMRQESKADNKSTRATMIVTGISSVFAIVLGIAAFNATVLSNMVASFESGKNTASAQAASEKALIEATKALEAATEKAKQATSNPAPPAPTGQPQQ